MSLSKLGNEVRFKLGDNGERCPIRVIPGFNIETFRPLFKANIKGRYTASNMPRVIDMFQC